MAIRPASGYERLKQLQEEQKEREEKKPTYANNFLRLADGENVELRFLYNLMTENHEREMVAVKMHDYWLESEKHFVQAVCAKEDGKQCHWCSIAKHDIDLANTLPGKNKQEKDKRRDALKNAWAKAAKDHFILPCFVYGSDPETGKRTATAKLLDLKWSLLPSLQKLFENGLAAPNGDKIYDITTTDFIYSRETQNGKTVYSLVATGYMPKKFTCPPTSRIMEMILADRPYRELVEGPSVTMAPSDVPSDNEDEDEFPF
jgi:hypothetical protein